MRKNTRITIETDSLLVLRDQQPLWTWCPHCGEEAEMIPLNDVGVVSNLLAPEVQEWMESADLHHARAVNGDLLVCLSSMLKRIRRPR